MKKQRAGHMGLQQHTIGRKVTARGVGLQSGEHSDLELHPAPANGGIVFVRTDLPDRPEMRLPGSFLGEGPERRTVIATGAASIQTVEHLLAALWGAQIDNVRVHVHGEELPAMDGSAAGFLDLLDAAGRVPQPAEREFICITDREMITSNGSSIELFPDEGFSVSYEIDYPVRCVGRQTYFFDPSRQDFGTELARARTFCLKSEAEALLAQGFGKGADTENTLILDEDGPVGTRMRFDNEPVRHKVLDLLGDLYMLARPLKCRIKAVRSGHKLNGALVRHVFEKYLSEEAKQ